MAKRARKYQPIHSPVMGARAYRTGELSVFVAHEGGYWHLSIAHPRRNPTWQELHDCRYDLIPDDVYMALILPPRAEYVNIHKHAFHLWEVPGANAPGMLVQR